MAIVRDTSTQSSLANPATSVTWSHTTAAGSDRLLVVGGGIPVSDKLTSVTYNGVSCTKVEAFQIGDARGAYLHYLVAPSTGANNVTISGSSDAWKGTAVTYTGVDQTTPVDVSVRDRGLGASLYTDDLTTTVNGCVIVGSGRTGTSLANINDTTVLQTGNGLSLFEDASGTTAGTVTVEMDVAGAGNADLGWVLAAFRPAGAGGGGVVTPRFLGFARL